jgi:serine/threonine-protein kinase
VHEVSVGDRLDQYQVTELVSRGAMGSIYKAVDAESGETVALKVPHFQYESDVVFFDRFRREEEILHTLDHPGVVGVRSPRERTRLYLAMEWVEGRSLRSLLSGTVRLPRRQALDIARQAASTLACVHARGVVHRDLKPENIHLTRGGDVKLLDFGIALLESARRLTWAGFSGTLGTPDYMAPEQIRGRRGDERTDVYALGTILYESLTGRLPHQAPNTAALLRAKTEEAPTPVRELAPDLDPALARVVMRAIACDPRDRQSSAAALHAELTDPGTAPARGREERGSRRPRRAHRRALLSVAVALCLCGGAGGLFWRIRERLEVDRSTVAATESRAARPAPRALAGE